MNKSVLIGRLANDPQVKYTSGEHCVAMFTLAVSRPFKNQQGNYDADFIPIVVWNKAAEMVGNRCAKGHRLAVEGRIQVRSFETKDGTKKWMTEVVASNVEFLEKNEKTMGEMGTEVAFEESGDIPF